MTTNQTDNIKNPTLNPTLFAAMAQAAKNKLLVNASIEEQKFQPKLPEGIFIAIVTNAVLERNQPSMYGTNDRIKVYFSVCVSGNDEPVEFITTYWKSATESSLYNRHLSALLGHDARDGFKLSDLIGITCQIQIKHNTTEKGVFANIDSIKLIKLDMESSITF